MMDWTSSSLMVASCWALTYERRDDDDDDDDDDGDGMRNVTITIRHEVVP